jgi:hypothetical protein
MVFWGPSAKSSQPHYTKTRNEPSTRIKMQIDGEVWGPHITF